MSIKARSQKEVTEEGLSLFEKSSAKAFGHGLVRLFINCALSRVNFTPRNVADVKKEVLAYVRARRKYSFFTACALHFVAGLEIYYKMGIHNVNANIVGTGGLASARSRSRSDSPPDCHSLRSRRFTTPTVRFDVKVTFSYVTGGASPSPTI